MTQNESAIEQINLGFNEQEDRLLLRVGLADKTEVAVWITRRVCKSIYGSLQSAASTLMPTSTPFSAPTVSTPKDKKQAIDSFVRESETEQKIAQLDFKSEYISDRQARSALPLLALQCLIVSIDNLPPYIELQCSNGQSVKMALTHELVQALSSMLQLTSREAGWDLLSTNENTPVSMFTATQTLH